MSHRFALMLAFFLAAVVVILTAVWAQFIREDSVAGEIRAHCEAGIAKRLEQFQGSWLCETFNPVTTVSYQSEYHIDGDLVTYRIVTGPGTPGRYSVIDAIEPSHDPPWIDWTAFDIPSGKKAASQRGVYRFEVDTLILNMSRPGYDRPTKVTSERGPENTVLVLKRSK